MFAGVRVGVNFRFRLTGHGHLLTIKRRAHRKACVCRADNARFELLKSAWQKEYDLFVLPVVQAWTDPKLDECSAGDSVPVPVDAHEILFLVVVHIELAFVGMLERVADAAR